MVHKTQDHVRILQGNTTGFATTEEALEQSVNPFFISKNELRYTKFHSQPIHFPLNQVFIVYAFKDAN